MPSVNEISKDKVLIFKGEPHLVIEFQHVNPGKGSAFVRTRLRNARSGKVFEQTYKAAESVDFVELDRKHLQYTYNDGTNWYFMDKDTFDEIFLSKEMLGANANYLKEGMEVDGWFYEGQCLSVVMPKKVTMKVTEAMPAVKGDSSGNITKEVTLENGYKVQAPIFIKTGDNIVLNTETGAYVERSQE